MKYLLVFILLVCTLSGFAQPETNISLKEKRYRQKDTLEKLKLEANISKVDTLFSMKDSMIIIFTSKENIVIKKVTIHFDETSKIKLDSIVQYNNTEGFPLLIENWECADVIYDSPEWGMIEAKEHHPKYMSYHIRCEYDKNNRIILDIRPAKNDCYSKTVFRYDTKGNCIKKEAKQIAPFSFWNE